MEYFMKTALLLIPDTNGSVNRQSYITSCVQRVIEEGYTPLSPAVYEHYTDINIDEFIVDAITKPDMDTVFLFVDFGIDKIMFSTIDMCISQGINLKYVRLQKPNLDSFYTTPEQILRDVSRKTGYSLEDLMTKCRRREIVDARYVYFRRCREISKASQREIGIPVGKDHSTVVHGLWEAYNNPVIVKLYEKCYGETKIEEKTVDPVKKPRRAKAHDEQDEGPVLPHYPMDKREPVFPREEPALRPMPGSGFYSAFRSYRPHNS